MQINARRLCIAVDQPERRVDIDDTVHASTLPLAVYPAADRFEDAMRKRPLQRSTSLVVRQGSLSSRILACYCRAPGSL